MNGAACLFSLHDVTTNIRCQIPLISQKLVSVLALFTCQSICPAEIDSGGGKSIGGVAFNHSSIGGSFATLPTQGGPTLNRPGLIEVIYPVVPSPILDSDDDGFPDAWEKQHFGALGVDPAADADKDGTTNLMEYLAGTNPNLASSVFRPLCSVTRGIFRMPIQTVSGRSYQIWVTCDLLNWTLQNTLTGDDTQQVFEFDETAVPFDPLHTLTHPSSFFFRVQIQIL